MIIDEKILVLAGSEESQADTRLICGDTVGNPDLLRMQGAITRWRSYFLSGINRSELRRMHKSYLLPCERFSGGLK